MMAEEAYIVEVHEPADIERAVAATLQRAQEDDITVVLDHKEDPCTVRGYAEPLLYDEETDLTPIYEDGEYNDDGEVLRREDGGLSFYHNDTVCYMEAGPLEPGESKSMRTAQADWQDRVEELLAEVDERAMDHEDADIHTEDGQIAGTSVRARDGAILHRACIYDQDPFEIAGSDRFQELLEADGIDPGQYHDAITTPQGALLEHLEDELDADRITATEYLAGSPDQGSIEQQFQAVQERSGGGIRGSCVLSDYACQRG